MRESIRRRLGLAGVLPLAMGVAAAGVAWACTVSAKLTASSSSGAVNSTITVSGSSFVAGNAVTLSWDSSTASLAQVIPDSQGSFTTPFTIPAAAVGAHYIHAVEPGHGAARYAFEVTGPPATPQPVLSYTPPSSGASVATPVATVPVHAAAAPGSPAAAVHTLTAPPAVAVVAPPVDPAPLSTPVATIPGDGSSPAPATSNLAGSPTAASLPASQKLMRPALGVGAAVVLATLVGVVIRVVRRRRARARLW